MHMIQSQAGYHLLPPQGLASPELEQVCNRLYGLAENVGLWK